MSIEINNDDEGNPLLDEFAYTKDELEEIEKLNTETVDESQADDVDNDFLEDLIKENEQIQEQKQDENQDNAQGDGSEEDNPEQELETQQDIPEIVDYTPQLESIDSERSTAQTLIDDVLDEIEKLGKDLDNGEIGEGEYNAKHARLNLQLTRHEARLQKLEEQYEQLETISQKALASRQESADQLWRDALHNFVQQPENELFKTNTNLASAFDSTLHALGEAGQLEGLTHEQVLATVRASVAVRHPELNAQQPTSSDKATKKPPKPNHQSVNIPLSLSSTPSVDDSHDSSPFAYLEKLSGIEYEAAVAKLTPAQAAAYYGAEFIDD